MSLITYIDIIGTVVFAISGWYTAIEKRLDIFGASIVAMVTAIGGGTLRDVLLGNSPVSWLSSSTGLICVAAGIFIAIIGGKALNRLRQTLFLFDSIGLGMFTILGLQLAMAYNISVVGAIILGVASATAGGVIRDILCNEIPLIFREELYATPCILGGSAYYLGITYTPFEEAYLMTFCIAITVVTRILAVKFEWKMPAAFSYR